MTSTARWHKAAASLPVTIACGRMGLASSISYVCRSFSPLIEPAAKLGTISDMSTYWPRKNQLTNCRASSGDCVKSRL